MTLVNFPTMSWLLQMTGAETGYLITDDSTTLSSVSETTVWRAMASRVASCFFLRLFKLWEGDHSCEAKTDMPASDQFLCQRTLPEELGIPAIAQRHLLLLHMNSQFVLRFYFFQKGWMNASSLQLMVEYFNDLPLIFNYSLREKSLMANSNRF